MFVIIQIMFLVKNNLESFPENWEFQQKLMSTFQTFYYDVKNNT